MSEFRFEPAPFIPFRDVAEINRVCALSREELTRHKNPGFRIEIVPDADFELKWMLDMFHRVHSAMTRGERLAMILPQPYTGYRKLAALINRFGVDCRNLHCFNMDEYANEKGDVAPETWPLGFGYSLKQNLYFQIDPALRPPESQFQCISGSNLADYGKLIEDAGGADIIYLGPGWTGHLAFVEPDAPEFAGSLEEWKKMGPRVCTLSPFTIAQNSLHGSFGMSGNLCAVPPKGATIGPAQVIAARHRIDMHAITVDGSFASWQRVASRLVLHGPVTPRVPESILQTLRTDVWLSESVAADIQPRWDKGY